MCGADAPPPPPPPPAAPPVLEQQAPKSAAEGKSAQSKKRKGLSRYKIDGSSGASNTTGLGGITKKTGV